MDAGCVNTCFITLVLSFDLPAFTISLKFSLKRQIRLVTVEECKTLCIMVLQKIFLNEVSIRLSGEKQMKTLPGSSNPFENMIK